MERESRFKYYCLFHFLKKEIVRVGRSNPFFPDNFENRLFVMKLLSVDAFDNSCSDF